MRAVCAVRAARLSLRFAGRRRLEEDVEGAGVGDDAADSVLLSAVAFVGLILSVPAVVATLLADELCFPATPDDGLAALVEAVFVVLVLSVSVAAFALLAVDPLLAAGRGDDLSSFVTPVFAALVLSAPTSVFALFEDELRPALPEDALLNGELGFVVASGVSSHAAQPLSASPNAMTVPITTRRKGNDRSNCISTL